MLLIVIGIIGIDKNLHKNDKALPDIFVTNVT
jgi:hypothetical protein